MEQVVAQRVSSTSAHPGADPKGVGGREYQALFEKNQGLQRQMLALSEENIELKFENEQHRKDAPRLKVNRKSERRWKDIGNYPVECFVSVEID